MDRKLQAEYLDERLNALNLGPEDKSRSDQVSAQLESLRHPKSPSIGDNAVAATVTEWNENFFQPRGIWITTDPSPVSANIEEKPRMPGEWIPYDHELLPESSTVHGAGRNTGPGRRGMFSGLTFPGMDANSRGFRFGPIVADSEGFRIGKNGLVVSTLSLLKFTSVVIPESRYLFHYISTRSVLSTGLPIVLMIGCVR